MQDGVSETKVCEVRRTSESLDGRNQLEAVWRVTDPSSFVAPRTILRRWPEGDRAKVDLMPAVGLLQVGSSSAHEVRPWREVSGDVHHLETMAHRPPTD